MIDARLALALDGGGLALPESGTIVVAKPQPEANFADLPKNRVCITEGFKPAYDIWSARGFVCDVALPDTCAAVVIALPRSKSEARALIALAMAITDGPVVIDGQKTDGVDSILKAMRKRVAVSAPISKAHGKLFWCIKPDADAFSDWRSEPSLTEGGFWTAPGVFSADAVDPASAMLVETLPDKLGKQVVDLGAGWGFLSAHLLMRPDITRLHLVEAEYMALECARRNVTDPRAVFDWADAMDWRAPGKVDCVVMNPPFHVSRAADPAIGKGFVHAAARVLSPQGQLWMVANRHLPYEQTLKGSFANVVEVGSDTRFKVFHASRPIRAVKR